MIRLILYVLYYIQCFLQHKNEMDRSSFEEKQTRKITNKTRNKEKHDETKIKLIQIMVENDRE